MDVVCTNAVGTQQATVNIELAVTLQSSLTIEEAHTPAAVPLDVTFTLRHADTYAFSDDRVMFAKAFLLVAC